ncbi:MAG: hypothetical protein Q9198_005893 [Flavoplaca austrocitrina]
MEDNLVSGANSWDKCKAPLRKQTTHITASAEEPSTLTEREKFEMRMLELEASNLARKESIFELESTRLANPAGRRRINSDDDHFRDKSGTRKKKKASRPKTPSIESARTFDQIFEIC